MIISMVNKAIAKIPKSLANKRRKRTMRLTRFMVCKMALDKKSPKVLFTANLYSDISFSSRILYRRSKIGETRFELEVGGNGKTLTVSQLTRRIKTLLEGEFLTVLVEGEVGSVSSPPSGHLYITLKDNRSIIDVVVWRSTAGRLATMPREGDKIEVAGSITLYEPRGRYQLVASRLNPAGEGELRAEFEVMVARLREEGLFSPEHKKELPALPGVVGIVTSASGAAVRDIIKVARKRMPSVELVVSPCTVQGGQAPEEIVTALSRLQRWGKCDIIIIGRGGGSLEDLAPFNDERVARAVFACPVPVVSAVGHEVDISICDLVSDVRAATPSEAAEIVVPEIMDNYRKVELARRRLDNALCSRLATAKSRIELLARSQGWRVPEDMLAQNRQRLDYLAEKLAGVGESMLERNRSRLSLLAARLEGLNPLGILQRGYSVTRTLDNVVIKKATETEVGSKIRTSLAQGSLISEVIDIEER